MTTCSTTDAPTLVIGLVLTGRSRSCCRWEDARVDALESTWCSKPRFALKTSLHCVQGEEHNVHRQSSRSSSLVGQMKATEWAYTFREVVQLLTYEQRYQQILVGHFVLEMLRNPSDTPTQRFRWSDETTIGYHVFGYHDCIAAPSSVCDVCLNVRFNSTQRRPHVVHVP